MTQVAYKIYSRHFFLVLIFFYPASPLVLLGGVAGRKTGGRHMGERGVSAPCLGHDTAVRGQAQSRKTGTTRVRLGGQ